MRPPVGSVLFWAFAADVVPLYPLYALLFADTGLSDAAISALLLIWSAVGFLAEVPTGALADRFSRRAALAAGELAAALGFLLWTVLPSFAGFAAGFVLWAIGGALGSGAFEALLYDGLAAAGAADRFGSVLGQARAIGLLAQLPVAVSATALFALGGYPLAGWVSVGCCLATALLAIRLPEARPGGAVGSDGSCGSDGDRPSYLATIRAGLEEVSRRPGVRSAVIAVAVLAGFDAVEEYFTLLAKDWGVPVEWVPLVVLVIPLAGAIGASAAGWTRWTGHPYALTVGVAAAVLGAAGLLHQPWGLLGIALGYGLYRLVLVGVEAQLQDRLSSATRATVTSVAGLGTELACFAVYGAWALGQIVAAAVLLGVMALCLTVVRPRGSRATGSSPTNQLD